MGKDPDGGRGQGAGTGPGQRRVAWTLANAVTANFFFGTLFTWSIFIDPVQAELDVERAAVSTVFSSALVAFALAVLIAGPLIDRGYAAVLVACGAVAAAMGLALTSRAETLAVLTIGYAAFFGTGSGLGYAAAVSIATRTPQRVRGLATGLVVAAFAAGPIVAAPVAGRTMAVAGWRTTLLSSAVVVGLALALVAANLWRAVAGPLGGTPQPSGHRVGHRRSPPVVLLAAVFMLGSLPGLAAFGHAASIMIRAGAPGLAGAAVGVLAGGNLVGRVVAGAVSDHLGRLPTLATSLAATAAATAYLGWAPPVLPALFILGAGYGALSASIPVVTAEFSGRSGVGSSYGQIFLGWGTAGLLGPLLGGWIFDATGGYGPLFQSGVVSAVAAAGIAVILWRRSRRGR